MPSEIPYTKILTDGDFIYNSNLDAFDDKNKKQTSKQRQSRNACAHFRHVFTLIFGIILGVGFSSITLFYITHTHSHVSHLPSINSSAGIILGSCGSSPEEAIERGCHYDMMASTWDWPECHNHEILEEMVAELNLTWYLDQQHTQIISQDIAYSGKFSKLYPLADFHVSHCLYLWRKLHMAVLMKTPIDEDILLYEHTLHCSKLIMDWHNPRKTVTRSVPGFPVCRKYFD